MPCLLVIFGQPTEVCGGGDGGEVLEVMGSWWRKEEEEGGEVVVVVGMVEEMEEMEGKVVEELVVEEREKVASHGKARGCFCCYGSLAVGDEQGKKE